MFNQDSKTFIRRKNFVIEKKGKKQKVSVFSFFAESHKELNGEFQVKNVIKEMENTIEMQKTTVQKQLIFLDTKKTQILFFLNSIAKF